MNLNRRLTCASLLLAAAVPLASALSVDRVPAAGLAGRADLIFLGTVLAVEYRNSDVEDPRDAAIPHTFVTLQIERSFKGRSEAGDVITLRFRGGPDGKGRVLTVPGVPLFQVGGRELLFVRGNGEAMCPLVGWHQGRLRVVDGLAYTDDGREVWLEPGGGFAFGRQHELREVVTSRIGDLEFHARLAREAQGPVVPAGAQRLDEARLLAAVARLAGAPAGAADVKPTASARPDQRFRVAVPRPAAPPAAVPQS